jgi:hypothetical protein
MLRQAVHLPAKGVWLCIDWFTHYFTLQGFDVWHM